jgi:hypothetical protein
MAAIKNDRPLTLERAREVLEYDAVSGVFRWRITLSPKGARGTVAGCIRKRGYRIISIDGTQYKASRLAWLISFGVWPTLFLDHINRIKSDDRLSNLREATVSDNAVNQRGRSNTGTKGVYLHPDGYYYAAIVRHGRRLHLGSFKDIASAIAARQRAAAELHGEFACED